MKFANIKEKLNIKFNQGKKDEIKQYNLTDAKINHTYVIKGINIKEKNTVDFLFSLGCFEGQTATVISILSGNYIINIKGARYSVDIDLAKAILI